MGCCSLLLPDPARTSALAQARERPRAGRRAPAPPGPQPVLSRVQLWWPGSRFLHVSVEGSIWTLLLHPDPKPEPDSAFCCCCC